MVFIHKIFIVFKGVHGPCTSIYSWLVILYKEIHAPHEKVRYHSPQIFH